MKPRWSGRMIRLWLFVGLCSTSQVVLWGSVDQRLKIGLALGGGEARGFAHLGVIEWLEKHRIPVDYVAGTSMGGLVGGLYAMGMSPPEMRELIQELDWDTLLAPGPSFSDLDFRRKEDKRAFPAPIELGWKKGLKLADALISGHPIQLLFDRLTLPYSSLKSFDELPIPFRCTAVDLVTGKRMLLKEGSFSQALSATMAIPGVFKPVEIGDRLLVDGGLLDNLPARVVKEMGADIVIAIDVGTPLKDQETLASIFNILDQSIGVMMIDNVRESRRWADIIIAPDLGSITSSEFKKAEVIAEMGAQATEQKAVILQSLSLSDSEWVEHLQLRRSRRRMDLPRPDGVLARGAGSEASKQIEKKLRRHVGKTVNPDEVEADLNRIYGSGRWSQVGYQVEPETDPLFIDVTQKSHGPPFVNLAFLANNTETDDVQFSLESRMTFLDLGGYGAEWRIDTVLGSELSVATEYYRPLTSGFFMAPRLFASSREES